MTEELALALAQAAAAAAFETFAAHTSEGALPTGRFWLSAGRQIDRQELVDQLGALETFVKDHGDVVLPADALYGFMRRRVGNPHSWDDAALGVRTAYALFAATLPLLRQAAKAEATAKAAAEAALHVPPPPPDKGFTKRSITRRSGSNLNKRGRSFAGAV